MPRGDQLHDLFRFADDDLGVLGADLGAVSAEDAAVFQDTGFAVLDGDGLDHAFVQALEAVVALNVLGEQIFRHVRRLFLDIGINLVEEEFLDILLVDLMEEDVPVFQVFHRRIVESLGFDGNPLGAAAQAETGPQFDEILHVAFLDDLFHGLNDIVGPFQVAGTAYTDFQNHSRISFNLQKYPKKRNNQNGRKKRSGRNSPAASL